MRPAVQPAFEPYLLACLRLHNGQESVPWREIGSPPASEMHDVVTVFTVRGDFLTHVQGDCLNDLCRKAVGLESRTLPISPGRCQQLGDVVGRLTAWLRAGSSGSARPYSAFQRLRNVSNNSRVALPEARY